MARWRRVDTEAWLTDQHRLDDAVEAAMRQRGLDADFPIIGPLVGRFCEVMARSIGARRVFEMGSGFGYSTWWFAQVADEVIHTDGDEHLSQEAMDWLTQAGLVDKCRFIVGDALEALEAEDGEFDIIFIDVDKGDYPRAFDLAASKIRIGGMILTDNTLWSGKVADPSVDDEWTQAVREYDAKAFTDARFVSSIVPLRDGLAVSLRVA